MDNLLLNVHNVSKSFPGVKALADVGLDVRHNEVLALVGENGAGKSTLMKLLSGIHAPDSGSFELDGRPIQVQSPKQAQELGISIIHQEFNLMPDLTVAQNIYIGREPRSGNFLLNDRRLNARAAELFARIRIDLDPKSKVGDLTVAKQQMVEIAKALSHDSKVLIMDEPTAALNEAEVAALHEIIRNFKSESTGVIYISHRMDEINEIADRVTVLRDGGYVDTVDAGSTPIRDVISMMVGRRLSTEQRPDPAPAGTDVVLAADGVSTRDMLSGVSFELRAGEILGFAGLMGAGRTEVARAIVGADRITAGSIEVHGRQQKIPNPAAAASLGIGYLSEDRKHLGLLLDRNVKENIALSSLGRFSGGGFMKGKAMAAKAQELVGTLRIKTPSVNQPARNLSGGNQQKVVIAKWLLKDCDILIFDEPTRGIDVGAKEEIYTLLNELASQGKSIIMISSELPEVLRLSHRIVVMCEGRVAGSLSNDEADQENIMEMATRFGADDVVPAGAEPAGGTQ
ncbi:sugar ABC transporter ATP-binding protein [Arthrobacter castelli]|uniref:sugar ABC transporter ATP-binding protein n=1 Tax=Arthrobacter castelli TaxID=271431 RepID=UPI0003FF730B|nr:sugar ABC transporter ATP-binding protein [Arthrobacter castelli]